MAVCHIVEGEKERDLHSAGVDHSRMIRTNESSITAGYQGLGNTSEHEPPPKKIIC